MILPPSLITFTQVKEVLLTLAIFVIKFGDRSPFNLLFLISSEAETGGVVTEEEALATGVVTLAVLILPLILC